MMVKTLSITTVKARLPELVDGVEDRDEEIVITRNGEPAAVIISCAEIRRLRETIDVLSDPTLLQQVRESRAHYARGGVGESFEDVFGEPLLPQPRRR